MPTAPTANIAPNTSARSLTECSAISLWHPDIAAFHGWNVPDDSNSKSSGRQFRGTAHLQLRVATEVQITAGAAVAADDVPQDVGAARVLCRQSSSCSAHSIGIFASIASSRGFHPIFCDSEAARQISPVRKFIPSPNAIPDSFSGGRYTLKAASCANSRV